MTMFKYIEKGKGVLEINTHNSRVIKEPIKDIEEAQKVAVEFVKEHHKGEERVAYGLRKFLEI